LFFEIQRKEQPNPSDIEQIIVKMPQAGVTIVDNNELRSHNAQYVLSIAALRGEVQVADIYRDERSDPGIASMMKKVRVSGDPLLDTQAAGRFSEPAVVEIHMKDGRVFSVRTDAASGDPEKPLGWDNVVQKFEPLATPVAGAEKVGEMIALVGELDTLDDMSRLCALIRA
jgi:2-methylcitrate dehydratase